ncbi:MAG: glycosyltransferase family 4 protein [Actinomycetota bacterium]
MRAVIDARPALDPRRTGVGHYTQQVIRHLPHADPDSEYVAWYLHAKGLFRPREFFGGVHAPNLEERASRFPARVFEPMSSRLGVPRIEWSVEFDVLLATNFLPPVTKSPGVVMVVHDLAYERLPETAPHMDGRWRRRFDSWLRRAAGVLVPSESTKRDLLEVHPVDAGLVHVTPLGVDVAAFAPAPREAVDAVRRKYGVDQPYALFVGGIEPRKNLDALVRAFARLPPGTGLVIAGGPVRWDPKAADRLDVTIAELPAAARARIVRTGYVSDREKVALMSGATLIAYPSLYEGFGFPVLEGFAAGLPVLTSNVSSIPEVAGDVAIAVDPRDEQAIAKGLAQLFEDEDLRAMLSAAGLTRASRFTWEATARHTARALHAALEVAHG